MIKRIWNECVDKNTIIIYTSLIISIYVSYFTNTSYIGTFIIIQSIITSVHLIWLVLLELMLFFRGKAK